MPRISISLPDELHADLTRLAASSHVSISSTVRAILADVVPRMTSVLDYIGTAAVTASDVAVAESWLADLEGLLQRAPETLQASLEGFKFDLPPSAGGHD